MYISTFIYTYIFILLIAEKFLSLPFASYFKVIFIHIKLYHLLYQFISKKFRKNKQLETLGIIIENVFKHVIN